MKVRELIQDLLLADQDAEVYVGRDGLLVGVELYTDWSAEKVEDGALLYDDPSDTNAIVLWTT